MEIAKRIVSGSAAVAGGFNRTDGDVSVAVGAAFDGEISGILFLGRFPVQEGLVAVAIGGEQGQGQGKGNGSEGMAIKIGCGSCKGEVLEGAIVACRGIVECRRQSGIVAGRGPFVEAELAHQGWGAVGDGVVHISGDEWGAANGTPDADLVEAACKKGLVSAAGGHVAVSERKGLACSGAESAGDRTEQVAVYIDISVGAVVGESQLVPHVGGCEGIWQIDGVDGSGTVVYADLGGRHVKAIADAAGSPVAQEGGEIRVEACGVRPEFYSAAIKIVSTIGGDDDLVVDAVEGEGVAIVCQGGSCPGIGAVVAGDGTGQLRTGAGCAVGDVCARSVIHLVIGHEGIVAKAGDAEQVRSYLGGCAYGVPGFYFVYFAEDRLGVIERVADAKGVKIGKAEVAGCGQGAVDIEGGEGLGVIEGKGEMRPGSEGHGDAGGSPVIADVDDTVSVVAYVEGAAGVTLGHELMSVGIVS